MTALKLTSNRERLAERTDATGLGAELESLFEPGPLILFSERRNRPVRPPHVALAVVVPVARLAELAVVVGAISDSGPLLANIL